MAVALRLYPPWRTLGRDWGRLGRWGQHGELFVGFLEVGLAEGQLGRVVWAEGWVSRCMCPEAGGSGGEVDAGCAGGQAPGGPLQ